MVLFSLHGLNAQELKNNVTIVTPYEPTITDARKINLMPEIKDSNSFQPRFDYAIENNRLNTAFEPREIKAAKMTGEPLNKLQKGFVKLGIGNYTSPLAQVYFNNLRSKQTNYGFFINHHSTNGKIKLNDNNKVFAGYAANEAGIFGNRLWKNHSFSGNTGIEHKRVNYYGYNTDSFPGLKQNEDSIKQNYIAPYARFDIRSNQTDSNKLRYHFNGGYEYFSDLYKWDSLHNYEHAIQLKAHFSQKVKELDIHLKTGFEHYEKGKSIDSFSNTIFFLHPYVGKSTADWKFNIGFNFVSDFYNSNSKPHFYPDINFSFKAVENVMTLYVGLNGFLETNQYGKIARENPFIKSNLNVLPSNHKLNLYGGIRGNLFSTADFNLSAQYSTIENQYFFVNDTIQPLQNQFITLYDDIDLIRLNGEISYQLNNTFNFFYKIVYSEYSLIKLSKPWHLPALTMTGTAKYNLRNKILVGLDIYYIGKRYAFNNLSINKEMELKPITDINLSMEYRYTKILSFFLQFNNMAAMKYETWYRYPTQRFHILGGFTYSL